MNNKGFHILGFIVIGFVLVLLVPFVLMRLNSMSKVLFQIIMVFTIIGYVKQMGLDGALMWIISGVLCYFIVYKYIDLFASLYMLMLLMGFGFTSAIMWGSNTVKRKVDGFLSRRSAK